MPGTPASPDRSTPAHAAQDIPSILEVLKELRAFDPAVQAIVSSGYSSDPVPADHRRYGFDGRLAKPYRLEDLGSVLQAVLHGPGE